MFKSVCLSEGSSFWSERFRDGDKHLLCLAVSTWSLMMQCCWAQPVDPTEMDQDFTLCCVSWLQCECVFDVFSHSCCQKTNCYHRKKFETNQLDLRKPFCSSVFYTDWNSAKSFTGEFKKSVNTKKMWMKSFESQAVRVSVCNRVKIQLITRCAVFHSQSWSLVHHLCPFGSGGPRSFRCGC